MLTIGTAGGGGAMQALAQPARPATLESHVAWVDESLTRMESIKPGMTRADLLRIFTEDGGLQNDAVFVFRDCGLFKVIVEWEHGRRMPTGHTTAERIQSAAGRPDDKIKTISRPYIQRIKID